MRRSRSPSTSTATSSPASKPTPLQPSPRSSMVEPASPLRREREPASHSRRLGLGRCTESFQVDTTLRREFPDAGFDPPRVAFNPLGVCEHLEYGHLDGAQ